MLTYNIFMAQDEKTVAAMFKALGDPTRLRMFRFLCSCCGTVSVGEEGEVRPVVGATVGEVCCSVMGGDKITSTVSFHLKELRNAGLIQMEKRGKYMICTPNREAIEILTKSLEAACACC